MKVWILAKKENFSSWQSKRFKETAEKNDIELKLVCPADFEIIVSEDDTKSILYKRKPIELPNCLIPRMGSGSNYFGLAVIRQLEMLGVLVLNSAQGIINAKDKFAASQILAENNIPIPKTILAKFPLDIKTIEKVLSYPLLIKTVTGSFGKGIFKCDNREQLDDVMGLIEASKDLASNVILQEFVSSSSGRDIRVFVVGGRPIGAMLRKAKKGFKANYSIGGLIEPFQMNSAIEWLASESARVVGLDIAGVDILFDGDSYSVCEVNSAPGFEGFEKATNLDVPKEIFEYIKVKLSSQL